MKTIIIRISTLFTVLLLPHFASSQVYELDKIKGVPSLDEDNMRAISSSVWYLYQQVLAAPLQHSNLGLLNDTVYAYRDGEVDDKHEKLSWERGKLYTVCNRDDLDSSNRILFNLTFNEEGKLIIPDTLVLIANWQQVVDKTVITKGQRAFKIDLTDSIKEALADVRLERIVNARKPLPGGEYPAVSVKIPFHITYLKNTHNIKGKIVIRRHKFDIFSEEKGLIFENDTNIMKVMMEFLEYKLLQYKKGTYTFTLVRSTRGLQIDMNIRRHNVWISQQTKNFPVYTYSVENFTGTGARSRHYRKVRKEIALKMKRHVHHWPRLDK